MNAAVPGEAVRLAATKTTAVQNKNDLVAASFGKCFQIGKALVLPRLYTSRPIKRIVPAKLQMDFHRLSLRQVQVAVGRARLEPRC
jgi:hypothetical protein